MNVVSTPTEIAEEREQLIAVSIELQQMMASLDEIFQPLAGAESKDLHGAVITAREAARAELERQWLRVQESIVALDETGQVPSSE